MAVTPGGTPAIVRRAAVLVGLQGAALAGIGVVYAVAAVTGAPQNRAAAELAAAGAVAVGAMMVAFAWALARARRWSRSPVVVLEIIALPVGTGLLQGHQWVPGSLVLAMAACTLYQLATPAGRGAFRE